MAVPESFFGGNWVRIVFRHGILQDVLGCVLWLLENVDVDTCPLYGASGGALAATLTACRVDVFRAFDAADRLAAETGLFERPLGETARFCCHCRRAFRFGWNLGKSDSSMA